MRYFLSFIFLKVLLSYSYSQNNLQPINSYYRDQLYQTDRRVQYTGSNFLPVSESEYNIIHVIRDSSILYNDVAVGLLQKHMVELKGKDYQLNISALGNFSLGRDVLDTLKPKLFQNTRGVLIEGDLFKNFSFSTSFFENQARFSSFESQFVKNNGEYYSYWNGYSQQNGVVSGGARTKPFKTDAFDYAYAIGNFIYKPIEKLSIIAGNNQQFIGAGYRSMLLSNSSCGTPYLRLDYKLNSKWSFNYLRSRYMNLVRKRNYTTVEGYYQPKGFSANYITYQPNKKLSLSFFEGSTWSMGDSLTTKAVNPLFFAPVLGFSLLVKSNQTYSIYGLNVSYILGENYRFYGQVAVGRGSQQNAVQIGIRAYDLMKLKNSLIQIEFNMASKNMYISSNARLNYSNYNLPIAHIRGTGFKELLIRFNWEYKRYFIELKSSNYFLSEYNSNALLPLKLTNQLQNGIILNEQLEVGFRFNPKLNVNIFASLLWRNEAIDTTKSNLLFQVGIRTGLMSQHNDY
jgi:hypothetical protein